MSMQNSLFLLLLIIVIFSIVTIVNLLLPNPVCMNEPESEGKDIKGTSEEWEEM